MGTWLVSVNWCIQAAALLPPEDQEKKEQEAEGGKVKRGLSRSIWGRS